MSHIPKNVHDAFFGTEPLTSFGFQQWYDSTTDSPFNVDSSVILFASTTTHLPAKLLTGWWISSPSPWVLDPATYATLYMGDWPIQTLPAFELTNKQALCQIVPEGQSVRVVLSGLARSNTKKVYVWLEGWRKNN